MLGAASSRELAEIAARHARRYADAVMLHALDGDRLIGLAFVNLPAEAEAAVTSAHAPDAASLTDPALFDMSAGGLEAFSHATAIALRAGDRGVGRLTLLCRSAPPREELPDALIAALGPALGRSLEADAQRLEAGLLKTLLPMLSEGVIIANSDGRLLHYNRSLQEMVGWSAEDIQGSGWTNLVYPDPEYRAEIALALATLVMGRGSRGTERWLTREDGRRVRAAIWSAIEPNPLGGAPALIGVMHDVSAEEEELQRQRREEGLVQLGERMSAAAHDLNNLLCAVLGHAELLGLHELSPALKQRSLATIARAAQSGATIVQGLLITGGTTAVHPAPTDIGRLVRRAVDLARPEFGLTQRLRSDQSRSLPLGEADAAQLHRALNNLLVNAREAAGDAGVIEVSTHLAALPEDAIYRAPGSPEPGVEMVRIRVTDTGPGFSPEALAHLFVPFYTTKVSGHGIGLGVVQGAARACRGALDVHNAPGAVVDLYLPVSDRPEVSHPQLAASADGRGRWIWLIEENPQVIEFSEVSLSAAGFLVRSFSRCRDAILIARTLPIHLRPEVMVLDLSLADGHGTHLATQLAEEGILAPVVWISGQRPPEPLVNPGGPSVFLPKPYSGQSLTYTVTRLLEDDEE